MATKKTVKVPAAKEKKVVGSKTNIKLPVKAGKSKATTPKRSRTPVRRKSAVTKMVMSLAAGLADPTQDNLGKFDHIVVLMLENRSFDHMLGYLKLNGSRPEVDGLAAGMSNDFNGRNYPIEHLKQTAFESDEDPCHESDCVTEQLSNNNGGFASNFGAKHPAKAGLVMGYYTADELPVYDLFAREYAICNKWFCSVDGATWPNRLYSITGQSGGRKDNRKVLPPIYDLPSFVRHLDASAVSWKWYCHHNFGTLRYIDGDYRFGHNDNFAYFDRQKSDGGASFLEDAASGDLASVSWIDPSFVNAPFVGVANSNDDHPPSDIIHGQELVLKLYNALASGPKWDKTLLIVVYDEHGGFFDHFPPLAAIDDRPAFRRYGVRVPSFIVSPFVKRGTVSDVVFDHTSIIKTILLRFCLQADGSYPDMGARVTAAKHLGSLLTLDSARKPATLTTVINTIAAKKTDMFKTNLSLQASGELKPPGPPNELQLGMIKARKTLQKQGFPDGQP